MELLGQILLWIIVGILGLVALYIVLLFATTFIVLLVGVIVALKAQKEDK